MVDYRKITQTTLGVLRSRGYSFKRGSQGRIVERMEKFGPRHAEKTIRNGFIKALEEEIGRRPE